MQFELCVSIYAALRLGLLTVHKHSDAARQVQSDAAHLTVMCVALAQTRTAGNHMLHSQLSDCSLTVC